MNRESRKRKLKTRLTLYIEYVVYYESLKRALKTNTVEGEVKKKNNRGRKKGMRAHHTSSSWTGVGRGGDEHHAFLLNMCGKRGCAEVDVQSVSQRRGLKEISFSFHLRTLNFASQTPPPLTWNKLHVHTWNTLWTCNLFQKRSRWHKNEPFLSKRRRKKNEIHQTS